MATTARPISSPGARLVQRGEGAVSLNALATQAGLHPDLVRRLVALGLIEPGGGTRAAPLFRRQDAALLHQALRLRRDLGLNYAGAILACELLARIDELEAQLRAGAPPQRQREVMTWTQTG
jgi:DNA-binding transcriptional MerR regulator